MIRKKRAIGTFIIFIVLLILVSVKCAVTRPKPISTETYVDENGTECTYSKYDLTAGIALDTKSYVSIMVTSTAILATACNFERRKVRLSALKKRCTVSVPAVVTSVRCARSDDKIRYRQKVYNATYRYEYLGTSYESNNFCYGAKRSFTDFPIKAGDKEKILINPEKPNELFDNLAEFPLSNSRFNGFILSAGGIAIIVVLLIR